jgi:hypothetical protein
VISVRARFCVVIPLIMVERWIVLLRAEMLDMPVDCELVSGIRLLFYR